MQHIKLRFSGMTTKAIPASVLALLKHQWKEADPRYSAFDSVFTDANDRTRQSDPSYYHIRPGEEIEHDGDVFTHVEATELVKEGVFSCLAKVQQDGGSVTINEHAQHALTDFCSEVYSA